MTKVKLLGSVFTTTSLIAMMCACSTSDDPTPIQKETGIVKTTLLNQDQLNVTDHDKLILELRGQASLGLKDIRVIDGDKVQERNKFLNSEIAEFSFDLGVQSAGDHTFLAIVEGKDGQLDTLEIPVTVSKYKKPGLVFETDFEGKKADDLNGGLKATAVGPITFAQGHSPASQAYQGAENSYLTYDVSGAKWMADKDQAMTISLWYKNDPAQKGRAALVTLWGDDAQAFNGVAVLKRDKGYSANIGMVNGDTWCGSSAKSASGGSTIVHSHPFSLNSWDHIVLTIGKGQLKMYVNGELSVTNKMSSEINWKSVTKLTIGSGLPNYNRYKYGTATGQIDNVKIYNATLSADDVSQLFNNK
ncbi:LamG domain-containing protein [Persicobacter psychrovividus]|uniref:LamG domain-containing protein n=1 Tax=Persicobacter psychrovividus TaxID=387638 RepID=A0ABM7VI53_9BACT|nr:hypothetical protein PEPS_29340 [Persicobacter psychrovividus]